MQSVYKVRSVQCGGNITDESGRDITFKSMEEAEAEAKKLGGDRIAVEEQIAETPNDSDSQS